MKDATYTIDHAPRHTVVVRLKGVLTNGCKPFIGDIVSIALQLRYQIIFSLKEVEYLNSDALGAFISAQRYITQAGGKMAIAEIPEQAMKLLTSTMLNTIFNLFDTIESAVESVGVDMSPCCGELLNEVILSTTEVNAIFLQILVQKLGEKTQYLSSNAKKRLFDVVFSQNLPTSQDEESETPYWRAYLQCKQ